MKGNDTIMGTTNRLLNAYSYSTAERYNTSKRTFARIAGEKFKTELKEIGVDMGETPYPKFAVLVNGEVRIADDVVDVDLPGEVSKARA